MNDDNKKMPRKAGSTSYRRKMFFFSFSATVVSVMEKVVHVFLEWKAIRREIAGIYLFHD